MRPNAPIWIWIVLALVVGATGTFTFLSQPAPAQLHRSSVLIQPPSAVEDSVAEVQLFVTDLSELIASNPVLLQVIEQVPELTMDDYRVGIAARRIENTSFVEVSFTHPDEEVSMRVVEVATGYVLDQASRRPFEMAQHLLETSEARLADAEEAMDVFVRNEAVYDPEAEYRAVIDEIDANEVQIATLTIEGADEESISYLVDRNQVLLDEKERLGLALNAFRSLEAELENARASVEEARTFFERERFEYETVNSTQDLVMSRDTVVVYDSVERLQRTALAAALAFGLGLITIVPLGSWLVRRYPTGRHRNGVNGGGQPSESDQMEIELSDQEPRKVLDNR